MVKTILPFILAFSSILSIGQNLNWQTVNLPFSSPVNSILFVDSLKGYATQENKLLSTLDGGDNWRFVDSLVYQSLANNKKLIGCLSIKDDTLELMVNEFNYEALLIKLKIDSSTLIIDSTKRDVLFLNSKQSIGMRHIGLDSNQSLISYTNGVKQTHFQHATGFEAYNGRILATNYQDLYISQDTGASWDTINLPNIFSFYSPNRITSFSQDTISIRYLGFPREEYITFDKGISWQSHDTTTLQRRPYEYHLTNIKGEVIGNWRNVFVLSSDYGFNFFQDTVTSINPNIINYQTYYNKFNSSLFIYGDSGKIYKTTNYDRITLLSEKKLHIPKIILSPNPTQSSFNISNSLCHDISQLKIYNQKGQLVKQISKPCHETDVSDFKSGVYVISGMYKGKRFSSKLIVQDE